MALVTGGATGLGLAIARRLARSGDRIVLASRSPIHLRAGAAQLARAGAEVLTVPCDIRDPAQVEHLFGEIKARLGRLDRLVNNAAGNFVCPASQLTPNGWRAVVGIVLDGTFYCSRFAYPLLRQAPAPAIVNIVATYAWTAGPGTAHSAAAKAGVVALTRTLAVEWASDGITVNAVAPGPVRTPGTDRQLWRNARGREAVRHSIPLGRFGTPDEIAEAVAFLSGEHARFVTGAVLTVDGGQWLGDGPLGGLPPTPARRRART